MKMNKHSHKHKCSWCNNSNVKFSRNENNIKKYYCSTGCSGVSIIHKKTNEFTFVESKDIKDIDELNDIFYKTFNSKRDWTQPAKLYPEMYGNYKVEEGQTIEFSYSDLRIKPDSFFHEDEKNFKTSTKKSKTFKMVYDVWTADSIIRRKDEKIVTLVLTNGVPVNRREWWEVSKLCSHFFRVVTVDLFGMGESSKPLDFKDSDDDWFWSWKLHAEIFKLLFDNFRKNHSDWFITGKLFFGANDWGAGAVQKFIEMYGEEYLLGASINSAIALNGYWVQHIGSLQALAILPYPSPTFSAEAIRFAGTLTGLLETMFHRTPYIHNQYTMALLQEPYVEISYSDPTKNPSNTIYKEHSVRVLAQQASVILGNGELLPFHSERNLNGLKFFEWNVPILSIWGKNDKMMPEGQVHRFANIVSIITKIRREQNKPNNLSFIYRVFEKAGHFAISDQPIKSADAIIDWIRNIIGVEHMYEPYIGFDSIARQDEINNVLPILRGLILTKP